MFRTFTNWVGNILAAIAVVLLLVFRLETVAAVVTLILSIGYISASLFSRRPATAEGRGCSTVRCSTGSRNLWPGSIFFSISCVLVIRMTTAGPERVLLLGLPLLLFLFGLSLFLKRSLGEDFSRALDTAGYLSTLLLIGLLLRRQDLAASYALIVAGLVVYSGIYLGLFFLARQRWHLLPAAILIALIYYFSLKLIPFASAASLLSYFVVIGLVYAVLGFLLARKENTRESTPIYVAAVIITFTTTVFVITSGVHNPGWAVFLISALVYGLIFILTRRNELVYLITLTLGFLVYNRVQISGDKFSLELIDYFFYGLIIISIFLIFPLIRRLFLYSRPFSLLIIKNWKGMVVYSVPVAGLIALLLVWSGVESTKNPYFCGTCHKADPKFKPQYDSWQASAHKKVACVKCHYPPGIEGLVKGKIDGIRHTALFLTRSYSTAQHAKIIGDKTCLQSGCHVKEDLYRPIMFDEKIKYNHQVHLTTEPRGMKISCATCHAHTVEGEHFKVEKTACFTCHFYPGDEKKETDLGNCLICHNLPEETVKFHNTEFAHTEFFAGKPKEKIDCLACHSEVTSGKGKVPTQRCFSCHDNKYEITDIDQLHASHLGENKRDCFECHSEIKHGLARKTIDLAPDCATCHKSGHTASEKLYMGQGGVGLADEPGPMYLANVDCQGCHRYDDQTTAVNKRLKKAGRQSCIDCHEQSYGAYLDMWKEDTTGEMAQVRAVLASIEEKLNTVKADLDQAVLKEVTELYDRAKANYNLVQDDGSYGVHNKDYADSLLGKAKKDSRASLKLLEKAVQSKDKPL